MAVLRSGVDPHSEQFARNREAMAALLGEVREHERRTREASAKAKGVFDRRGQLLPRERVGRLLDPGFAVARVVDARGRRRGRARCVQGRRRGRRHRRRSGTSRRRAARS